ncbi:MAG: hypothetical protein MJE77_39320 [Proteobacteria bacterium]|nr:hypothetical protein [Pseudomonadota bacterium]
MAEDLNPDFADVIRALCAEKADFLIVGAYAVAFHGTPRATGDLDLLVRPSHENAERVWRALARFGAPMDAAGVTREDFAQPGMVYQIGLVPRRIDILTQISGVDFEDAWSSRVETELVGETVHFIGRKALMKNKSATGRDKDLLDLRRLEALEHDYES